MAGSDRTRLKKAIHRAVKPWIEAWSRLPDHEFMVQSLLKGAEHRLMEKRGEISSQFRETARRNYDWVAYRQGEECADRISERIYSVPLR